MLIAFITLIISTSAAIVPNGGLGQGCLDGPTPCRNGWKTWTPTPSRCTCVLDYSATICTSPKSSDSLGDYTRCLPGYRCVKPSASVQQGVCVEDATRFIEPAKVGEACRLPGRALACAQGLVCLESNNQAYCVKQ